MLQPGESQEFRVQLNYPFDAGRPASGEYEASVVYYARSKRLLKGAPRDVVTTRVRFSVVSSD